MLENPERKGTEPEVIDAQYRRGRWTLGKKLALVSGSDLTFCNSYKDGTSTSREPSKAYETAEVGYSQLWP